MRSGDQTRRVVADRGPPDEPTNTQAVQRPPRQRPTGAGGDAAAAGFGRGPVTDLRLAGQQVHPQAHRAEEHAGRGFEDTHRCAGALRPRPVRVVGHEVDRVMPLVRAGHGRPPLDVRVLARSEDRLGVARLPRPQEQFVDGDLERIHAGMLPDAEPRAATGFDRRDVEVGQCA